MFRHRQVKTSLKNASWTRHPYMFNSCLHWLPQWDCHSIWKGHVLLGVWSSPTNTLCTAQHPIFSFPIHVDQSYSCNSLLTSIGFIVKETGSLIYNPMNFQEIETSKFLTQVWTQECKETLTDIVNSPCLEMPRGPQGCISNMGKFLSWKWKKGAACHLSLPLGSWSAWKFPVNSSCMSPNATFAQQPYGKMVQKSVDGTCHIIWHMSCVSRV